MHGDHTGGNENIKKAGATIAGGNVSGDIKDAAEGAQIWAHDNVLLRMSDPKRTPAIPTAAWPTSTFTGKDKKLFFNGEGVHIIHEPAAHTDGDSIVFFRRSCHQRWRYLQYHQLSGHRCPPAQDPTASSTA